MYKCIVPNVNKSYKKEITKKQFPSIFDNFNLFINIVMLYITSIYNR